VLPIVKDEEIPKFSSVEELKGTLTDRGCRRCTLGFQPGINGCCVSRGSTSSSMMIIGEAPGRDEDSTREPFTGPAGRLMDKIWESVGLNSNDFYITNVVKCRPIASKGSGKENFTPKVEQRKLCTKYILQEIKLLRPKIIIPLGATATSFVFSAHHVVMGAERGKLNRVLGMIGMPFVFPMYHPAAILHAQSKPELNKKYRQDTWTDIQQLKKMLDAWKKEGKL